MIVPYDHEKLFLISHTVIRVTQGNESCCVGDEIWLDYSLEVVVIFGFICFVLKLLRICVVALPSKTIRGLFVNKQWFSLFLTESILFVYFKSMQGIETITNDLSIRKWSLLSFYLLQNLQFHNFISKNSNFENK